MMQYRWALMFATAGCVLVAVLASANGQTAPSPRGNAHYDGKGRLIAPADYREWVFLSAGLDMNYGGDPAIVTSHVFGNVFAPPVAYRSFQNTGVWPEGTVLILENRRGSTKGSINKGGQFQTEVVGLEAHVKDTRRFKGGWGFYAFDGGKPAERIGYDASCYACHRDHAAADTTFVQFYPTLLPTAARLKTLNPAYLAEERRR